jgi:hypothetical protein
MAGRFQAPVTPSLAELNSQALAGDRDACLLLARRSGSCDSFTCFLDRYVPDPEIVAVFDVYADAWMAVQREKTRALLDTLELPAVEPGNLNTKGWSG